jgi:hypothetical protein
MQTVQETNAFTSGTWTTDRVGCAPGFPSKLTFSAKDLSEAAKANPLLRITATIQVKADRKPGGWQDVQEFIWCGCAANPTNPEISWIGDFTDARLEWTCSIPVSIGWAASSKPVNGGAQ